MLPALARTPGPMPSHTIIPCASTVPGRCTRRLLGSCRAPPTSVTADSWPWFGFQVRLGWAAGIEHAGG